jgi:hypothetical protein
MEKNENKPRYSIFFPLLVLAAGVILLINNFSANPNSTANLLISLWPLLLITGGLDSIFKREGFISPLIFVGLGTVFLLSSLGYSSLGSWQYLLRYWPVIIIAIGLDILLPFRNLLTSIVGLLLAAGLMAGIYYLVTTNENFQYMKLVSDQISMPADDINEVSVDLQMNVGEMTIGTDAKPANAVEGNLYLTEFSKVTEDERIRNSTAFYTLKSGNFQFFDITDNDNQNVNRWDIQLNPEYPTRMETTLIAGQMTSELSEMRQLDMENTVIFGESIVILPDHGDVSLTSSVIFGELEVVVPDNANVVIIIDTAIDTVDTPQGFKHSGNKIYSPNYDANADPVKIEVSVPFGDINIVND